MNNYTDFAKDLMLLGLPGTLYVSLHETDPGGTGAGEVAGTTRAAITLESTTTGGVRAVVEDFVDIDVAAGDTVNYVGFFDASTSGNFMTYTAVTSITFSQNNVYRVSDITFDLNLTV